MVTDAQTKHDIGELAGATSDEGRGRSGARLRREGQVAGGEWQIEGTRARCEGGVASGAVTSGKMLKRELWKVAVIVVI